MSDLDNVSDYNHKDPHITITGLGVTFVIHIDPVSNFSQFGMCNASGLVNEFWGQFGLTW